MADSPAHSRKTYQTYKQRLDRGRSLHRSQRLCPGIVVTASAWASLPFLHERLPKRPLVSALHGKLNTTVARNQSEDTVQTSWVALTAKKAYPSREKDRNPAGQIGGKRGERGEAGGRERWW